MAFSPAEQTDDQILKKKKNNFRTQSLFMFSF